MILKKVSFQSLAVLLQDALSRTHMAKVGVKGLMSIIGFSLVSPRWCESSLRHRIIHRPLSYFFCLTSSDRQRCGKGSLQWRCCCWSLLDGLRTARRLAFDWRRGPTVDLTVLSEARPRHTSVLSPSDRSPTTISDHRFQACDASRVYCLLDTQALKTFLYRQSFC